MIFKNLLNHGLQRFMNQLNQFNKITEDWGRSEELYNRIYVASIKSEIAENFEEGVKLKIVDGGSGTGGMAIEMAKLGHDLTGIELHKPSLEEAKRLAADAGVDVNWVSGDLYKSLQSIPTASVDVVQCIGVLYTCVQYREIFEQYSRILRPGGIIIASFKSKFYFITTLLRQKQFDKVKVVVDSTEGVLKLTSAPTYYNWQTARELDDLFKQNQFDMLRKRAVGVYTGAGTDGMAAIADVEQIPTHIMDSVVYELEASEPVDCLGAGRYTLAIGRKSAVN